MSITKRLFGTTLEGQEVICFKITGDNGMQVEVLNYGVTLRSLVVKDKNDNPVDVILGYDTLEEYIENNGFFGATVGRFANRIAKGRFVLNNKEYQLDTNNGENHLHGGKKGFNRYVWDAKVLDDYSVAFLMTSPDMDQGYPGELNVVVTVSLKDNSLELRYSAVSDKDTIINLTNHSYFNLNGKGDIYDQLLTINADSFTINDAACLPTGEIVPVENTVMDFRTERKIGDGIDSDEPCVKLCDGYDCNLILSGEPAIIARSLESGIVMTVTTDQPGVQLYTANKTTKRKGKNGAEYDRRSGFCLETQHFPDSINHPEWPTCILRAGEEFNSTTTFSFSISNK